MVQFKSEDGAHRQQLQSCMVHPTFTTTLTIGQLEANYPLYCKVLRILIREGKTMEQIQRSVCWHRLATLHHCLPRQYSDPGHLYNRLKRELTPAAA